MFETRNKQNNRSYGDNAPEMVEPIEPGRNRVITRFSILKWLIFFLFIIYVIVSYLHAPILTRVGGFLIKEHPPVASDLIVCLAGGNIERGLAAADAYREGLAPRIFIAREDLPDGYELLKAEGINYPESVDLMIMLLEEAGIPRSAIIAGEVPVGSTMEEARTVMDLVDKEGYGSLIILTSPTHTRRAWLTYRKVFEGREVRLAMLPSRYSGFRSDDWWKKRKYVRAVIIEYQKLIFYVLKYIL